MTLRIFRESDHVLIDRAPLGQPPLPIRQIVCVGRNYAEHAREMGGAPPERPLLFTKSIASLALDGEEIVIPPICQDREQVDYEGELCVIIGRAVKDASESHAADPASGAVLGYCCVNDVSARWWQKEGAGGQFYRGKSFDTFCPIGPAVTPAADAGDPQSWRIRTTVSGQVMQDDSTASMLFPVARLVADISRGATIPAGTLILTGSPPGVGSARTPQRFLRDGDTVEVEIGPLGVLRSRVRLER